MSTEQWLPSLSNHAQRQQHIPSVVIETVDATTSETTEGLKKVNRYVLKEEIGQGAFGKVHLGILEDTQKHYAIKEFSKSCLRKREQMARMRRRSTSDRGRCRGKPYAHRPSQRQVSSSSSDSATSNSSNSIHLIRTEVAILKKLCHRNVIKLYEVLDDPSDNSIYMVMEMAPKGVIMKIDVHGTATPYSEIKARNYFRQVILGIEYLHFNDIVHRDIKPDNLLLTEDDVVKIVDFGVSEMFNKGGSDVLTSTAGSPAFMPPELCGIMSLAASPSPVSGKAADIWSMGVTLYCLVHGHVPFTCEGLFDLYQQIKHQPVQYNTNLSPNIIHLLGRLLEKDPTKRATMRELRCHPWVTNDGEEPMVTEEENCEFILSNITEKDIKSAITRVRHIFTVIQAVAKFKRHKRSSSANAAIGKTRSQQQPSTFLPIPQNLSDTLSVPVPIEDSLFHPLDNKPLQAEGNTYIPEASFISLVKGRKRARDQVTLSTRMSDNYLSTISPVASSMNPSSIVIVNTPPQE